MSYNINEHQTHIDRCTKALAIDKNDLDNEVIHQPQLFNEVSQHYVQALAQRDMLKQEVDLAKAQLDTHLRTEYVNEGVKYTEASLANTIIQHPEYQKAVTEHLAWAHLTNAWGALKESFMQRSYALKDLAALYISGYYAEAAIKEPQQGAIARKAANVIERQGAKRARLTGEN